MQMVWLGCSRRTPSPGAARIPGVLERGARHAAAQERWCVALSWVRVHQNP